MHTSPAPELTICDLAEELASLRQDKTVILPTRLGHMKESLEAEFGIKVMVSRLIPQNAAYVFNRIDLEKVLKESEEMAESFLANPRGAI